MNDLIWDNDPAKLVNANTYGTVADIEAAIIAELGSNDLVANAAGIITIRVRCSIAGQIETPQIKQSYWNTDASNYLLFLLEFSNNFPAILAEDATPNGDGLIYTNSSFMRFVAAEEDSGIIRASAATGGRNMIYSRGNDCLFENLIIDCGNNTSVSAISGEVKTGVMFRNCKIIGADREFTGAIRSGGYAMENCTFYDCVTARPGSNIQLNACLFVNTPFYDGISIHPDSSHNATTQAEADIPTSLSLGLGSIFDVDPATEIQQDTVGGFNLLPGSRLINADAAGTGNIGANAQTISEDAPEISISIAGDTLTLLINTLNDIDAVCTPYVNGSPVTAQNKTKTTGLSQLTWDLTSFSEIPNPASEVYTITVKALDTGAAQSTSNSRIFSQLLKIIQTGNSLSGPTFLADSIGGNIHLAAMVKNCFIANGSDIYYEEFLKGSAEFSDHSIDPIYMSTIGSGNYDLILMQGEGRTSVTPDVTTYYNTEAKPMVDAANGAQSDFVFYSHNQQKDATENVYQTEKTKQEQGAALLSCDLVATAAAWHAILLEDPTIDMWTDNTHQNFIGAYVNALCLYRYLTGGTTLGNAYQPASLTLAPYSLTAPQIATIQRNVDAQITNVFVRSTSNTCDVTITRPLSFQEYTEGDAVTFNASALDSSTGDLTANIEWTLGTGQTAVGTGGAFVTASLPTGSYTINARTTGSDGKVTQASRLIKVRALVNAAPVATVGGVRTVDYNEQFTQINLTAQVTDDNDEIDWSTLIITQAPSDAIGVAIDGQTNGVVNVDYSGTNFSGDNTLAFTVADNDGLVSNVGERTITVLPPPAPTGSIANATITRGASFDAIMLNYTAGPSLAYVEAYVKDLAPAADGTEYPCTVTVNTNEKVSGTAPDTGAINAMADAQVIIRPVISL